MSEKDNVKKSSHIDGRISEDMKISSKNKKPESGQNTLPDPVLLQYTSNGLETLNNIIDNITDGSAYIGGALTLEGLLQAVSGVQVPFEYNTLASNFTTTSSSLVSCGPQLGVSLISNSTRFLIHVTTQIQNNTHDSGGNVALYRSTVGVPSAGSPPAQSDVLLTGKTYNASVANLISNPVIDIVDTGLAEGTTYYYYVAVETVNGGTLTVVENSTIRIEER